MTISVISRFDDGVVLFADSRATYNPADEPGYHDALQKPIHLDKRIALAYAGDAHAAAAVIHEIRKAIARNSRLRSIRYLKLRVGRIARLAYGALRTTAPTLASLAGC